MSAAAPTLQERIDAQEKHLEGLQKQLNDANQTIRIQRDRGGPMVASYWEDDSDDDGEVLEVVKGRGSRRRKRFIPSVPADYEKFKIWKGYGDRHDGAFGEFLREGLGKVDGRSGAQSEAFMKRFMECYGPIRKAGVQGMSEAIGGDGGFAVLPEFSSTIFEKVYGNQLFGMTDQYTVAGNNMTFPRNAETSRVDGSRHGGLLAAWTAEGGTINKSKPTIAQFNLKLKKLAIVIYLTDELIEDAGMALQQYVTRKSSQEMEFQIGTSLINGTGGGQPQGVLNSQALLAVAKENGQAATTLVKENVDKMYARMFAGSIPNAVWLYNQDVIPALLGLNQAVGTGGLPVYLPPGGYSEAPYGTLLGRPLMPLEFCATLGTQGDLIFADMKQYVTISKGGIAQAQSMHVEFLTDQTALRFTIRLDGQTWENSPVTPYKGTNTQSSFVALATRS